MAESKVDLKQEIKVDVENKSKIDRHCIRDGTLMNTASIQWTDGNHMKHFTPIALVCRKCMDWKYLPYFQEEAYRRGKTVASLDEEGKERDTIIVDGRTISLSSLYLSKLEFADLMRELGQLNDKRRKIILRIKDGAGNIVNSDPNLKNAFKKMLEH